MWSDPKAGQGSRTLALPAGGVHLGAQNLGFPPKDVAICLEFETWKGPKKPCTLNRCFYEESWA